MVQLLNQAFVNKVANHRQPAADSMIECGLNPHKAVAYDFDDLAVAPSFPAKPLRHEDGCNIVFAASLIQTKGCEDVILAVSRLLERVLITRLTVFGDGPELPRLEKLAADFPKGVVSFLGRRTNDELLEAMRAASFVCVPTHNKFPEGSNLVLTQALSTRTPVIASSHPLFVRAFRNGEGVRFVRERQPLEIADAIEQLWNNPEDYLRLSISAATALERVRCKTLFGHLLMEWARTIATETLCT